MEASVRPCFLAVDDEPAAQTSYRLLLRNHGDVIVAATCAEARRQLASRLSCSAFLLDQRLPDGTGLELLAELRRTFPSTPAMIMTGHMQGWVANAAYDLGADALGKPIESQRMHHWIERALRMPADLDGLQPAAIREPVQLLRELLGRRSTDGRTRYAIGKVVVELKAKPDLYGKRAVAVATAALGEDAASLYRYSRVAERWSEAEVEELLSRHMANGRPLSWSHLDLLGPVTDALRDWWLERTLGQSLTVRALSEALEACGIFEPEDPDD